MTSLLTVEDARARMLAAVGPVRTERIPLLEAAGRVVSEPVAAARDQPPFDASAMDGWAVRSQAAEHNRVRLRIVGESAAGRPFDGEVADGEAVRIFTGAPVPAGCGRVVPQEDAGRDGEGVTLGPRAGEPTHLRPRGGDFRAGAVLIPPGVRLDAWRLALAAAAGLAQVSVAVRPRLAVLPTGEEIAQAGAHALAHQIYDSAAPALTARARVWGAEACALPPAGDDEGAIVRAVETAEADLIVTIGGASVGDHDLVKPALRRLGLELSVESVALRPGKPTWFGRLADGRRVLGLPGNPASALVCAELFLQPLLDVWQGGSAEPPMSVARLLEPLRSNGPREHWMRAETAVDADGVVGVRVFSDQDSSLVTVFAQANALLKRPAGSPAADAGAVVEILPLQRA